MPRTFPECCAVALRRGKPTQETRNELCHRETHKWAILERERYYAAYFKVIHRVAFDHQPPARELRASLASRHTSTRI